MAVNSSNLKAWSPDVQAFLPDQVIPDLILPQVATVVAGAIDGDEPVVRVPYISDDGASDMYAEGAEITEDDPTRSEVVFQTHKVAKLVVVSNEAYQDGTTAQLVANSSGRAISNAANKIVVDNLLAADDIIDGGKVKDNLDPFADAIATIQQNGGNPSVILVGPAAFNVLRKMKTAKDSNMGLLGSGTAEATPMLFGLPVTVTPALTGDVLVVDKNAVAAADGNVQAAVSTDRYFERDAVGMRTTYRFGVAAQRGDRIAKLDVTSGS